jgi:hypothetical protein
MTTDMMAKHICSHGFIKLDLLPIPTLAASEECYENDHESWGRPVCCAQTDLFIGLQAKDNT